MDTHPRQPAHTLRAACTVAAVIVTVLGGLSRLGETIPAPEPASAGTAAKGDVATVGPVSRVLPGPGIAILPDTRTLPARPPAATTPAAPRPAMGGPALISVGPAAPPLPAPSAPIITDLLTSDDGTLSTRVGTYSDCSGRSPLERDEAAVDTCVTGPVYFVGHNPGAFTPLMHLVAGSILIWHTHTGGIQRLRIVAVRDLAAAAPRTPTSPAVTAQLQTCVDPAGTVDRVLDAVPS